eukprot:SAG11_NODE_31026_length_295_cov_1.285714_1_plen_30_part_01
MSTQVRSSFFFLKKKSLAGRTQEVVQSMKI